MITDFYKPIKADNQFFIDAAKHVIAWNAKARGGETPEFTNEMFIAQLGYVREELKEFQDAAKINDHIELLDAAADVFVVASYLVFMFTSEENLEKILSTGVGDVFPETVYDEFLLYEKEMSTEVQIIPLTIAMLRMARDTLIRSKYNYKKVVKEVLRSNDSKYPTRKQLLDVWDTKNIEFAIAQECAAIEERNKDRPEGAYTGVHATYNEKQKVYVFFNDKGKIMKPSTFSKPDIKSIVG